jgi:hypothetical protein
MKYKYKGTTPVRVYDGGKSIHVSPGEEIELSTAPNSKFIEIVKEIKKPKKIIMEDKEK